MADRGFTIQESVALYQAQLAIPAFTRGKNQLDPLDGGTNTRICECANTCRTCHWTPEAKVFYPAGTTTNALFDMFREKWKNSTY